MSIKVLLFVLGEEGSSYKAGMFVTPSGPLGLFSPKGRIKFFRLGLFRLGHTLNPKPKYIEKALKTHWRDLGGL